MKNQKNFYLYNKVKLFKSIEINDCFAIMYMCKKFFLYHRNFFELPKNKHFVHGQLNEGQTL